VAVLIQSDRFRPQHREVLRGIRQHDAAERAGGSQRAKEGPRRWRSKLLFPMIIFIFPAS